MGPAPNVALPDVQPAMQEGADRLLLRDRGQPVSRPVQRLVQLVLHLALRVRVERLAAALPILPAEVDLRHPPAVAAFRDAAFPASAS